MSVSRPFLRVHPAWLLLVAPMLFGGKCKCKRDVETDTDTGGTTDVQHVDTTLQVASIDPAVHDPGQTFTAKVYGSAFKQGAEVMFNEWPGGQIKIIDENTLQVTVPALQEGIYDVQVRNADGQKSVLRRGLTLKASDSAGCKFVRVQFEFDDANLTAASKSTLDKNLTCYQASQIPIKIEGHTDERGTLDYNLALGQRRADSVRRYLVGIGVANARLKTVSYGEDRPLDRTFSESAWAANRRSDIYVQE